MDVHTHTANQKQHEGQLDMAWTLCPAACDKTELMTMLFMSVSYYLIICSIDKANVYKKNLSSMDLNYFFNLELSF